MGLGGGGGERLYPLTDPYIFVGRAHTELGTPVVCRISERSLKSRLAATKQPLSD